MKWGGWPEKEKEEDGPRFKKGKERKKEAREVRAGPKKREKKRMGRGLGKREEGDGLRLGFDSVGPVSFFSLLLVQAPMHFIHFFQFFNPYKINKNNIKIAN